MSDAPFLDLDAVVSPDIRVKLEDTEYLLPGDAPSEIIVGLLSLFRAIETTDENEHDELLSLREQINDRITDLFSMRQDLPEEGLGLTDKQTTALFDWLFKTYYAVGEDDAAPPTSTPAKPRSSRRSGPRAKAKPRASASSASSRT